MIPGLQSKLSETIVASATTISVEFGELVAITGATTIQTILTPLQGSPTMLILFPVDGAVALGAAGNILVGITMAQNRAVPIYWSKRVGKWYIDNGV